MSSAQERGRRATHPDLEYTPSDSHDFRAGTTPAYFQEAGLPLELDPIARISGPYNPNESYPEAPLGRGLTAQLRWITPEWARTILAKLDARLQRSVRKDHKESIKDDIRNGRFILNGETIILAPDGSPLDGQHRLQAVVELGIPILSVVIRGVPREAFISIGGGSKRTVSDAFKAKGHVNANPLGAATSLLHRYDNGRKMMVATAFPRSLAIQVLDLNPGLHRSVQVAAPARKVCQGQAAPSFCHYIFSRFDPEAADRFFHKLSSMEGLTRGDPVLTLRRKLEGGKFRSEHVAALTIKAWNAIRRGRTLMSINFDPKKEDFPEAI